MRAMLLIYRLGGRFVFRLFLYPVVLYYFLVNTVARNASLQYLRRLGQRYPELGIHGSLWDSYRHFVAFSENLLDKIAVWLNALDSERVKFPNRHLLLQLLEQGRGGILLGAHVGNLEICRAYAQLRDNIHLNVLIHTKHAEKFNRLLSSVERSGKIELIQVTELNPALAVRLHEKIDKGEFLVMVGDRIPVNSQGRTVQADFLGAAADFPQGPYLLASLMKCPVYTLFCYPQGKGYRIDMALFAERIAISRKEPQRSRELTGWAQQFSNCLEEHCRLAPLQWFNFFGFWDTVANSTDSGMRQPT